MRDKKLSAPSPYQVLTKSVQEHFSQRDDVGLCFVLLSPSFWGLLKYPFKIIIPVD
ncbi:MAG: hypothetical protein FD155_3108 [Bacteroidetes bacterium]|nr:MAG: hypothetical protein FD155_3108 [Bacteroidota bacterium]